MEPKSTIEIAFGAGRRTDTFSGGKAVLLRKRGRAADRDRGATKQREVVSQGCKESTGCSEGAHRGANRKATGAAHARHGPRSDDRGNGVAHDEQ